MPSLEETDPQLIMTLTNLFAEYGFTGVVNTVSQMKEAGLSNFKQSADPVKTFEEDLRHILNKWQWDTMTSTPDFLLASMVIGNLNNYNMCRSRRDSWFGQDLKIKYKEKVESE